MQQTQTFDHIPNNTAPVWYKDPGLRKNVVHCGGICLVIFYLGYDAGLINGLQAVEPWQKFLDHPQGTRLGLYAASLYLPSIITAYLGDVLSQRYGRRIALAIGTFLVLIGGLVNAFAVNAGMWVAGRAIIGAGGGIAKVAAPALLQEIAHPRLRPMLASCYFPSYYFGATLSALLCFAAIYIPGYWSWRMPSVMQALGPLLVLVTLITCPESPRWLVSKNRLEEAENVLSKYHANGAGDDPLVLWEMAEIKTVLAQQDANNQVSYLDFLRTAGNRRRLIVLLSLCVGVNWVGNGIISYYLTPVLRSIGITSSVQIMLLTCGLAIWNLIFAFGAAFNVERIGRRPLFLVSIAGMLVSYILVTGLSAGFAMTRTKAIGSAVIPFLFIYFAFYDIAWSPLPVPYTAEILPFKLRTKGLAIFTSVGTLANSFNQFVNPIALQAITWKYYIVYIILLLFYLIFAYFFYPETKNHTIEEVSMLFDKIDSEIKDLNEFASREVERRVSAADESWKAAQGSRQKEAFVHQERV